MIDIPEELIPTRRSLLARLKRWDDQESWQDFFNTYWRLIYGVATKAGLTEDEAQDVVQDTMVSVARQLPNFKYDSAAGSFKSWLFLITRRRIADHLRRAYRQVKIAQPAPGATSRTELIERVPGPPDTGLEAVWEEQWQQHILETAMQRVKKQVEPQHFQIFDCHVLKEWPVKDVVKAFGVKAGQVYVIKHRVSALLAEELRKLGKL